MNLGQDILDVTAEPKSPVEVRAALEAKGISPWEQDFRYAILELVRLGKLRLLDDNRMQRVDQNDWYEYDL